MVFYCPCGAHHDFPITVFMFRCHHCARIHCTICKSIHCRPCNCKSQAEKFPVVKNERQSILPVEKRKSNIYSLKKSMPRKVEPKRPRGTNRDESCKEFPVVKKERKSVLPVKNINGQAEDQNHMFCKSCDRVYSKCYFPAHLITQKHLNAVNLEKNKWRNFNWLQLKKSTRTLQM